LTLRRGVAKRGALALNRLAERVGVHILPVHYYSALPSKRALLRDPNWRYASALPGIHWDLDEQVETLRAVCLPFQEEYGGSPFFQEGTRGQFGLGYGRIEAEALHGVIRHYRPRRVVEVGSGVSTHCIKSALRMNGVGRVTCIEPHPSSAVRAIADVLVEQPVQKTPLVLIEELDRGDVLFVDSTHAVHAGSDVNHLVLEVLPRLRSGVVVHIHDLNFPYDYQADLFSSLWQWSEGTLVRAWMTDNPRVRTLFCMSALHHDRPDALAAVFPDYEPAPTRSGLLPDGAAGDFPASLFVEMVDR
jgi:hypothetical protein